MPSTIVIIDPPSTLEELLLWALLAAVGALIATSVKKPVGHWWDRRHDRQQTRREWYEDVQMLSARIEQRFFDEYWQPKEEKDLQEVGEVLEPTVRELGEKIAEAPDDANSTVHFAQQLHDRCVELKEDPDAIRDRKYGFKLHMRGPDVISHRAELTQRKAENELKRL